MVVVPAGEFSMGSPGGERYRGAEPLHRVLIEKPFAVGKFEVTHDEWAACVAEGGCDTYTPDDYGFGRGKRPVVDVNWNDAKRYLAWLSMKTGKSYRLLSEAEWEYAARAGTTTAFSFGNVLTHEQANIDASGQGGEARKMTLPVGSFPANAFGLHDMHGNAWEWVEDCWNDEVNENAPRDGSAWLTGSCTGRVMRGGSFDDYSGEARAAARVGNGVDDHYWSDGFRVARDL
jgi:formylglycine-generating enzyme required for sulfatase activity